MKQTNERVVKYLGGGFLIGVPARDLTLAEYKRHETAIQECPTPLYQLPEAKTQVKTKETKDG